MGRLKNHPNLSLNDQASASVDRMEAERGRAFGISSARRTVAEQQNLINRYDKGGKYNRPPYLYNPARPAEKGPHVINGGIAIDVPGQSDRDWIKTHGRKHGWTFPFAYDLVHAQYNPANDQYAGGTAVGGYNQDTKNRQDWLVSRGWKIKADGIFGPATREAYKEYQVILRDKRGYKGPIDGLWGAGTQAAHQLEFDAVQRANSRPSGFSQDTKNRQEWLKSRNWKIAADGVEGPATKQAYKEYQNILREKGFYKGATDGIWGAGTQAAHQREFDRVQQENSRPKGYNQDTKNRQDWLVSRGWKIAADGVEGPATKQAYKEYQNRLKELGFYNGAIDGVWGPGTEAANAKEHERVRNGGK